MDRQLTRFSHLRELSIAFHTIGGDDTIPESPVVVSLPYLQSLTIYASRYVISQTWYSFRTPALTKLDLTVIGGDFIDKILNDTCFWEQLSSLRSLSYFLLGLESFEGRFIIAITSKVLMHAPTLTGFTLGRASGDGPGASESDAYYLTVLNTQRPLRRLRFTDVKYWHEFARIRQIGIGLKSSPIWNHFEKMTITLFDKQISACRCEECHSHDPFLFDQFVTEMEGRLNIATRAVSHPVC